MIAKFVDKSINISSRTVDDFSYIYIENEKRFLKLNEVGSFIWEKIEDYIKKYLKITGLSFEDKE